jgi:hypothetical protein
VWTAADAAESMERPRIGRPKAGFHIAGLGNLGRRNRTENATRSLRLDTKNGNQGITTVHGGY